VNIDYSHDTEAVRRVRLRNALNELSASAKALSRADAHDLADRVDAIAVEVSQRIVASEEAAK
jgi:hypothetical protein